MIEHIRSINFSDQPPIPADELKKTFTFISHELDTNNLSPEVALDQALLSFNTLTDYNTSIDYDNRYYDALEIQKYAEGSRLFNRIADRLPDNPSKAETYEYADLLASRTHQSMAEYANSFSARVLDDPDRRTNLKDYSDTYAMSALLFEEQWHHKSQNATPSSGEAYSPIDTVLISEICKARCNFVESLDESKPLANRSDILKGIIESTSELRKELHVRNDLPAARGIYKLLSARIWHDRALLGEYGAGARRDDIVRTSVNELWDAADEILHAIDDVPHLGNSLKKIMEELEYFRGRYSEEVGIDANARPAPVELDIESLFRRENHQALMSFGRVATQNFKQ